MMYGLMPPPCSVVFAGDALADVVCAALPRPRVRARTRDELLEECATGGVIAFVSFDRLDQIQGELTQVPVVGVLDTGDMLPGMIRAFARYPWLSHVITSAPREDQLELLVERLGAGPEQQMIGKGSVGRVALLARSDRRAARIERMRQFFASRDVPSRAIDTLEEIADELVLNALYDAPAEAGFFRAPRQRVEDVDLPRERACEISYGVENEIAFVRVRDTFGALTRARLVEVLARCDSASVQLDESRGGAGLGLWRVFSAASSIAINVVPGSLTDVLVAVSARGGRRARQLAGVHLFVEPSNLNAIDAWHGRVDSLDRSFSLVHVA